MDANKPIKRHSASLITRKIEIITIMMYFYIPIRMVKISDTNNTKCY